MHVTCVYSFICVYSHLHIRMGVKLEEVTLTLLTFTAL